MLYINVDKIYPHPDNPRKDLGDLTELAESIKEQGILQNLTVVRNEDEEGTFRVIIGHRRLAAAKLAGKSSVPCVVSEMDYKSQVATMLLENMQRQDLTAYEQAQGFQMMLDLGASIQDIVRDTGLSETTVRHRIKLNDLDPELLKEKSAENINMFDLIKLEQIKDPELKNKALEKIGTINFEYTYNNLLNEQKRKEYLDAAEEIIRTFATEIDKEEWENGDYEYIDSYDGWNMEKEVVVPVDKDECEYFYKRNDNSAIYVYTESDEEEDIEDSEEDKKDIEAEHEREERYKKLQDILNTMAKLRMDYVKNVGVTVLKEHLDEIMSEAAIRTGSHKGDIYKKILEIEEPEDVRTWEPKYTEIINQEINKKIKELGALRVLTIMIYSTYESFCGSSSTFFYDGSFSHSYNLDNCYRFLEVIGYRMSDEEKQMLNGTHEAYLKKEKEDE